ncbi:MAG TPA: glycosyltransferase family 4 protein [Acidimicrobiales bacterium]|nr:glycosyltransferase family 4 protein [Acidimicrobiales bacterium]
MSGHEEPLRIAYLVYRGKPHVGGQGVYTRHLTKALVELGHHVEVFSGPPYPVLDERVPLHRLESLDLYREPDPFRVPKLREFKDSIDVREFALMCTAAFPEPYTFSLRAARALKDRVGDFDLVHDNQCLGSGLLQIMEMGLPVLGTIHHPITQDRRIELENAPNWRRRLTLRRWYAFTKMQSRVAQKLERIITVSQSSHGDIVKDHGVDPSKLHVVNVGVDPLQFRPLPDVARVPGRLMCTSSSDVPMKGVIHLMEAVAKIRTERPDVHVTVIGKPNPDGPVMQTIRRLDLEPIVEFVYGVTDERIVELYAEAELAVVPSLYEGFSLPAVEAMAAGVPLVATTGGAVGEVVGRDGTTAALVPPGDPGALATMILELMADPARRAAIGEAGRKRVVDLYSWQATATRTVEQYRALLAETKVKPRDAHV